MSVVLMIATLGVVALGYFIMRRIDAFIDGGGFAQSPQGREYAGFLVFGSHAEAEQIRSHGFRCAEAEVPDIVSDQYYSALFVLSQNDADNLLMCRNARDHDPGIFIIARCHLAHLRDLYLNHGADRVLLPGETIGAVLSELRAIRQ